MLRFDLSAYYSLLDVFDRTGRLMFPDDWTGLEAWARDSKNPDAVKKKRARILADLDALQSEKAPYQNRMRLDLSDEETQEASDALGQMNAREAVLKVELGQLPHVTDTWLADHAAYTRRITVEKELSTAFLRQDLSVNVGTQRIVPWKDWIKRTGFSVSYSLSMIRIPKGESALRRGPAFVEKTAFNLWSERFSLREKTKGQLTPQAKCEEWLRAIARANPEPNKTSEELWLEARETIPGLKFNEYKRARGNALPEHWKKGGRKPNN